MRTWRTGLPLSPVVEAALLMVFGAVCVAIQNALIRLASAEIHTFEVVFFRNLFGLLAMLPLLGGVGLGMFRAHSPGRLLLMSAWHVLGMVCYFLAIVYLPLAEVTALAFSKPLSSRSAPRSSSTRSCAPGAGARSRSASSAC